MFIQKQQIQFPTEYLQQRLEMIKKLMCNSENILLIGKNYNSELILSAIEDSTKLRMDDILSEGILDFKKLNKAARKSIEIHCNETFKIVEGQITQIGDGFIILKTADMESRFEIGPKIHEELLEERVAVGDVIKIYKEYSFINKLGRALGIDNSNVNSENLIPQPSGECIKNESLMTVLSLDEIDIINFKEGGVDYLYSNIFVEENVQKEVNNKVIRWLKEKKIVIKKKPIVVENVTLSENEIKLIFDSLNSELEFLDGNSVIITSPIALNELSNSIISIPVSAPSEKEIDQILESFVEANKLKVDDGVKEMVSKAAAEKSVNFALNILNISRNEKEEVKKEIIEKNFLLYK